MTLRLSSSSLRVDPDFANVSLLLHGDGTNGSTTILDSSSSPKTVTAVGDAQISTAQSKFGGSSIEFDGAGDYLTVDSSDFAFGTGDFTVELWAYAAAPHRDYRALVTSRPKAFPGEASAFHLGVRANGVLILYSNQFNISSSANAMPVNAWCHIALVRANGSAAIYVNGVSVGTGNFTNNVTNTLVGIGDFPVTQSEPFDGYIDDLRITTGVARYTSNFTAPTAPFPDLSSTTPTNLVFQSPASNGTLTITSDQVSPPGDAAIVYGITSAGGTFNLRSTGTVDYEVDWGDGDVEISTLNTLPHTYAAGDYNLSIYSDDVYRPFFNNSGAEDQLTSAAIGAGADLGTSLANAWQGATNMTSFVCPFDATSSVTSFFFTWDGCSALGSFPLIDTSRVINFFVAWRNCSGLVSFPQIDTSSGTNFGYAWNNCSGLVSFPQIDTSAGTNFNVTWSGCSGLTSFPSINLSRGTNFNQSWSQCSSLSTFPANMFDTTGTLVANAFLLTWTSCALTAQSIENILVSLDTNGASNIALNLNGGTNAGKTTWSTAANTAYTNLINKGWTISFNP